MKFLYLTDTHIRGTTPKNRLDSFSETLKEKMTEAMEIANEENVDFILHGGDVFDRPDISPNVVGQFAQIFRIAKAPVYTISGNHDTYGHNPETVSRTMLGLLDAFGIVTLISPNEPLLIEKDRLKVQISGQPYHYEIDERDPTLDYYPANETGAHILIHLVHSMLVEKPLPHGVAHTLIDHIWSTTATIVLSGHYHGGFGIKEKDGKYICNPGAIARVNNHWTEVNRWPKVIIGTLSKDSIELKERTLKKAKAGEEVLDRRYVEKAVQKEEKLASFIQQVKEQAEFETLQMSEIIGNIAQLTNVKTKVKEEALRRIAVVEERWRGGEDELD